MGSSNMQKHNAWLKELHEYIHGLENEYRANNPEYKRQAEEYEEQLEDERRRIGYLM